MIRNVGNLSLRVKGEAPHHLEFIPLSTFEEATGLSVYKCSNDFPTGIMGLCYATRDIVSKLSRITASKLKEKTYCVIDYGFTHGTPYP